MEKDSAANEQKKDLLPLARSKEIVVQEINHELLVYDLETNRAHNLNETAAAVWKLCDGKKSSFDISHELGENYGTPVSEELVWLAIEQLNGDGLLENSPVTKLQAIGISRRDLIRKAGFASMIALPIVSTIIAPKPTSAQSVQSPCLPLNVCIGPSNICPPGCNGRTIVYDFYQSNNGTCTNLQGTNIPLACGPGGFFSVLDIEVTSA